MEPLQTARLLIRAFVPEDLPVVHRILDQTFGDGTKVDDPDALRERQAWVGWSILNDEWMGRIYQMPYGDRAIVLRATGVPIGMIGYVPLFEPFEQIPELAASAGGSHYSVPEVGLFWAVDPLHQRHGYATEAAQRMIEHAFDTLHLKRILATTDFSNIASQGVMQRLGMNLVRNPLPEPAWMQVVGVLTNPG
jgi:RimJ/RimL family protein N-acetyltransferase